MSPFQLAEKAGLGKIDKEKVNRIIYEMSKVRNGPHILRIVRVNKVYMILLYPTEFELFQKRKEERRSNNEGLSVNSTVYTTKQLYLILSAMVLDVFLYFMLSF